MSTRLDVGVELLERSLGYTRVALAQVRPASLTVPTPCSRWDLASLLAHMDDAMAAFLEAAGGSVSVRPSAPGDVAGLCTKACTLLGAWSSPRTRKIDVGGAELDAEVLLGTAALEITVHGWDVATALGLEHRVPAELAAALLPWARLLSPHAPFGRPVPTPDEAPPDVRLLAAVGRVSPTRRSR